MILSDSVRFKLLILGFAFLFARTQLFAQQVISAFDSLPSTQSPPTESDAMISSGYAQFKNTEVTTAITMIPAEGFNKGLISDPAMLIQGKIAGMQVYNRGGDPNNLSLIRIRNLSAFSQRKPLVVIDGVAGASLKNIDPNDIASIAVLKDGASQAIYGIRASNGVILIKTKDGSTAKSPFLVSYHSQLGTSTPYPGIQVLSADEFRAIGGTDLGSSTNWLNEVKRNGIAHAHSLAIHGLRNKTSYRLSGNFRNVGGVLRKSGFEQFNIRGNVEQGLLNETINLKVSASYTDRSSNLGFSEAFRYAVSNNPTIPISAEDAPFPYNTDQFGGFYESVGLFDSFNPKAIVDLNDRRGKTQVITTAALLEYKIKPNVSFNFRYAYQDQFSNERALYSTQSYFRGNAYQPLIDNKGRGDFNDYNDAFSAFEYFFNFNKSKGNTHLQLMLGAAHQNGSHRDQYMRLDGFSNALLIDTKRIDDYQNWAEASTQLDTVNNSWSNNLSAYFSRANLKFEDKFFLNTSLRYEGSSKLGENNKWGLFPSFSIAVDISKVVDIPALKQFKLRSGFGLTGSIPNKGGLSQEKIVLVEQEDGSFITNVRRKGNPELQHELKSEMNVGLDFKIGKLNGHVDWYTRKVKDWISLDNSDFPARYINKNLLKSTGLELGLNLKLIKNSNFEYSTDVLFSTYQLRYVNLEDNATLAIDPCCFDQNPALPLQEGESLGNILAPVYESTDLNGYPVYRDINGDGMVVTGSSSFFEPDGDFQVVGNGLPDFELGWNHLFRFRGWDLQTFFRGAFGHSLVNRQRQLYEPRSFFTTTNYNLVNTDLAVEDLRLSQFSSLYVEKSSFFKLDNLTISKTFPFGAGADKKQMKVSLTGQNLFVITNYRGADPEPVFEDLGPTSNGGLQSDQDEANPLAPGIDRKNHYLPSRLFVIGIGFEF